MTLAIKKKKRDSNLTQEDIGLKILMKKADRNKKTKRSTILKKLKDSTKK